MDPPADMIICQVCSKHCWFSELRTISFGVNYVKLVRFPLCGFQLNEIMFYLQQQIDLRAVQLH